MANLELSQMVLSDIPQILPGYTHAWILQDEDNDDIANTRKGPVDGTTRFLTSHCAELQRQIALLLMAFVYFS